MADRGILVRVSTAVLLGSAPEWYDYFLYGAAAALVFGQVFFPSADESTSLLLSLATFGVGFVACPIGAMVFGHIGDKQGRRPAATRPHRHAAADGPIHHGDGTHPVPRDIGVAAPILLVVMRLLQGMGSGAEYSGASVYAVEYAAPGRRGLFGSFSAAGVYLGLVALVWRIADHHVPDHRRAVRDLGLAATIPGQPAAHLPGPLDPVSLEETPEFEHVTEESAPARALS